MTCLLALDQDEFRFYLEDAQSKLLIVPAGGNATAEAAAQELGVPQATFAFSNGECPAFGALKWVCRPHLTLLPTLFSIVLRHLSRCLCGIWSLLNVSLAPPLQCLQTDVGRGNAGVHRDGVLRAKSAGLCIATDASRQLDAAQPGDVALFLHTSGTTSKPKVGAQRETARSTVETRF